MRFLIFGLLTLGQYALLVNKFPKVYKGAASALQARNPYKISGNEVMINKVANYILPHVVLDEMKRHKLVDELKSIGIDIKPEMFRAKAIAKGLIYAIPFLVLVPISFFFLLIAAMVAYQVILGEDKRLKQTVLVRKRSIERELPQFAGTIRQQLNNTRDMITILDSYRKVCGQSLRSEIETTLNDIRTGNAERALNALDGRVGSTKFSELIRGLVGINRGDDMKIYFNMLAIEYQKAENEAVKKELLERPTKLQKNMMVLFACIFVMTMLTLGMMIMANTKLFF